MEKETMLNVNVTQLNAHRSKEKSNRDRLRDSRRTASGESSRDPGHQACSFRCGYLELKGAPGRSGYRQAVCLHTGVPWCGGPGGEQDFGHGSHRKSYQQAKAWSFG